MNWLDEITRWGRNKDLNPSRKESFRLRLPRNYTSGRKGKIGSGQKQRVTIKISYSRKASKTGIANNTASAVAYMYKLEGASGYSADKEGLAQEEALKIMGGKKVFKMIISPEDPSIVGPRYTRKVMEALEGILDRKLNWIAIEHNDTDHPHTHVIISREDGEGLSFDTPLYINPQIIKKDLRERASDIATRTRGFVHPQEIKKRQLAAVGQKGFSSLDYLIEKKITNGFFDPKYINDFSIYQREFIAKRLDVLCSMGIGVEKGKVGYIFSNTWKENLYALSKIRSVVRDYDFHKQKITLYSNTKDTRPVIEGKIIAKQVIDELNDRVAFIIENSNGKKFYFEKIMDAEEYKKFHIGKDVKLQWKSLTNKKTKSRYDVASMEAMTL